MAFPLGARILLINITRGTLAFHLNRHLSIHGPTLRKDRSVLTSVSIPHGGSYDVMRELGVTHDEAHAIVDSSPDVKNLDAKNLLRVHVTGGLSQTPSPPTLDVWRQAQDSPPALVPPSVEAQLAEKWRIRHLEEQRAADDKRRKQQEVVAQATPTMRHMSPHNAEVGKEPRIVDPEANAAAALVRQAQEALPNTKWDVEKLRSYATAKGMQLQDGETKNALLRRILKHGG